MPIQRPTASRSALAAIAAAALPLSLLAVTGPTSSSAAVADSFSRVATYPVFSNVPAGVDPAAATVAEISAVTDDGRTVIYTDALGKRIGFLDITDPAAPKGAGSIELATLGHADDQPTSVAVAGGYALVAIDETGGNFTSPSGSLKVIRISDRTVVRSIDLGGQPDSIALSADGRYAAIAMENQRDEEFKPAGLGKGDLPQLPAGFVQILDLTSATDPATWGLRKVALTNSDGSALASFVAAGLDSPTDPEPEYVAVHGTKVALTMQENNGIAVIDLPTGAVERVFSAGTATVTGVDTTKDGLFNPTGTVTAPREPDSIAWVDEHHVATANEGDWKGGTRGWTVFDTRTGAVAWDAGNTFENLATSLGLHNNDRAAKKGAEPEGLTVATIGGKRRAFVGSERSNFVAVYDVTDPTRPVYEQSLATTNGPEGLLAVPARNLFVVSSETDDAAKGIRATIGVYSYGAAQNAFPSIVSAEESSGLPIGWGALGALSAVPNNPGALWAASDAAYKNARIYKVDTSTTPAEIERVITVRSAAGVARTDIDIEGLAARAEGGFWVANEGATGAANSLVRLDGKGVVRQEVPLPAEIAAKVGKWGFEGVTATGKGADEVLYAVLQRPLFSNISTTTPAEGNVARIGRFHVATGTWTWFTVPLETTSTPGDWIGLSEVTAVDADTLAIIERDKLNGPAAAVKRVYTVDLPSTGGTASAPVALTKKLALDVLPLLRAQRGWTQEKLEGLTIGADGQVYAVTDNDGLVDATGETQLLRLGSAASVFGTGTTPTSPTTPPTTSPSVPTPTTPTVTTPTTPTVTTPPTPAAERKTTRTSLKVAGRGRTVTIKVAVSAGATGKVTLKDGRRTLRVVRLVEGRATVRVTLKRGKHVLRAVYAGTSSHAGSRSPKRTITVR